VTFKDGDTTTIKGKRSIDILGSPTFHNVLFVNGLKANLLRISQFVMRIIVCNFLKMNATSIIVLANGSWKVLEP